VRRLPLEVLAAGVPIEPLVEDAHAHAPCTSRAPARTRSMISSCEGRTPP
jgi:hypothetical protein